MRRGDLFVLSYGKFASGRVGLRFPLFYLSGGGLFNSLLMGLLFRWS